MTPRRALSVAATTCMLVGCHGSDSTGPGPCALIVSPDAGLDPDVVLGFADLHAHPAIELAFGGRLIWGAALDSAPVDGTALPMIESCPVETHDHNASSPIDHEVGSIAFPMVAKVASFAHGPVGALTLRPSDAWPNARDVIHQQMNVSSIRRAYEGGLRLMFAAATDDQLVSALLAGPSFVNAFVPDPEADLHSAQAQLRLIDAMVEQNEGWMGIARSPDDARSLIGQGRLAIVMSLEMNGLTQDQLDSLIDDYGVRHIIPVHLIDNDVGGTAANSDIFNASSAETSELYRSDHRPMAYMDIAPSTAFSKTLGWPVELTTLEQAPLFVSVGSIPFSNYNALCYEPLGFCATTALPTMPSAFTQVGQVNFRGLCTTKDECATGARPGAARIAHMMNRNLFVDVSHMGYRSVADTLGVTRESTGLRCTDGGATAAGSPSYPLIASHGDIAHLCDSPGAPQSCQDHTAPTDPVSPTAGGERSLDADQARAIVGRGGVLGLGLGVNTYQTRRVLDARGGPLLTLDLTHGVSTSCVAKMAASDPSTTDCAAVPIVDAADANASAPLQSIQIQTVGGIEVPPGNSLQGYPFARVELLGPDGHRFQRRVIEAPLSCSEQGCMASIDLSGESQQNLVTLSSGCDGSESVPSSGGATAVGACSDVPTPSCADCPPYTIDHIEGVSLEIRYIGSATSALTCQSTSGDPAALRWTISRASVSATTPGGVVSLAQVGPSAEAPIALLGSQRGSFSLYQREDRPGSAKDVNASGRLFRVTLVSGAEATLEGASVTQAGANVCVSLRTLIGGACPPFGAVPQGATECPAGWIKMNQRGQWATGTGIFAFGRTAGPESAICGADVAVLDAPASDPSWTIDEVRVEAIEDPVGHFVRRYADIGNDIANGSLGSIAFGSDFNGLNGMMDISELAVPAGAQLASSCPGVGGGNTGLAPLRFRNGDGTPGAQVLIEERGLATYGLLADLMEIIRTYPDGCGQDVHDSLMLSAEATIRAWETILGRPPKTPLPARVFCSDASDAGASP